MEFLRNLSGSPFPYIQLRSHSSGSSDLNIIGFGSRRWKYSDRATEQSDNEWGWEWKNNWMATLQWYQDSTPWREGHGLRMAPLPPEKLSSKPIEQEDKLGTEMKGNDAKKVDHRIHILPSHWRGKRWKWVIIERQGRWGTGREALLLTQTDLFSYFSPLIIDDLKDLKSPFFLLRTDVIKSILERPISYRAVSLINLCQYINPFK